MARSPSGTKPKWHETQATETKDPWCVHQLNLLRRGACLLPRNPFPFTSQAFQAADALGRSTGKFPEKSSGQLLENSHSPASGWACHRQLAPQPSPSGIYQGPCCPSRVAKNCNQGKNGGSAACRNKSQTHEAGAGAKRKRFYSGATQPGRTVDSHLKDQLFFLLKPSILKGKGSDGLFFLSNYLASVWALRPYPFIFLAFGTLSVRTALQCHPGQWGRLAVLPFTVCGNKVPVSI